jgi:hypothetical protein
LEEEPVWILGSNYDISPIEGSRPTRGKNPRPAKIKQISSGALQFKVGCVFSEFKSIFSSHLPSMVPE